MPAADAAKANPAPAPAARPRGGFAPDAGSIESIESLHHAILNAAAMSKGTTPDSRDDINMALQSRWKDPGVGKQDAKPEEELPDSMLPLLREVLPYIDFIAGRQQELDAAISERDDSDRTGVQLRELSQTIRQTAELGVSKGIAERDFVPTQVTVNEAETDPSDPFAGGSNDVLERAGSDEMPEAPAAPEAQVPPPAAPAGQAAPAPAPSSPAEAPVQEPAAAVGQNAAATAAPGAQPPLSDLEAERISRAASEDRREGQEDASAPGPMMFGPDQEGFVEGRRPGESVQDMLARAQKAAMDQLAAEDQGKATLGYAEEAQDSAPPPAVEQPVQAAVPPQPSIPDAEPCAAPDQPAPEPVQAQPSQAAPEPVPVNPAPAESPSPAADEGAAAPAIADHAAAEPEAAPAQSDDGLKLVADPFSDDMSVSVVEEKRPQEDLAQAEAGLAAQPVSEEPQGSSAPSEKQGAAPLISDSLRQAMAEIAGGAAPSQSSAEAPASKSQSGKPEARASESSDAGNAGAEAPAAQAPQPELAQTPAHEAPVPEEPGDMDLQAPLPPDSDDYVPPDDDDEDEVDDEGNDAFHSQGQGAPAAVFEETQDSSVPQGVGDGRQARMADDGDPSSMPPAQRAELERIEKIEAGQKVRPLLAHDFMPYVRKVDPWLQDIEAAGYKDVLYSALISSTRTVDPDDDSRWTIRMSDRFSYFIDDPSFSHNLETKFSFLRNGHPVRITLERSEGLPKGCPLELASRALGDETSKARAQLENFKPFRKILKIAGADFRNVPITLYGSAGSADGSGKRGKA
jgi:hypothetical protein